MYIAGFNFGDTEIIQRNTKMRRKRSESADSENVPETIDRPFPIKRKSFSFNGNGLGNNNIYGNSNEYVGNDNTLEVNTESENAKDTKNFMNKLRDGIYSETLKSTEKKRSPNIIVPHHCDKTYIKDNPLKDSGFTSDDKQSKNNKGNGIGNNNINGDSNKNIGNKNSNNIYNFGVVNIKIFVDPYKFLRL